MKYRDFKEGDRVVLIRAMHSSLYTDCIIVGKNTFSGDYQIRCRYIGCQLFFTLTLPMCDFVMDKVWFNAERYKQLDKLLDGF